MAAKPNQDPIAAPLRELVTLFDEHLAEVQFPSVDGNVLRALTERAHEGASALEQARVELARLERELDDTRAELLVKAEQALAYAKVYALTDSSLLGRLNAIALPGTGKKARQPAKAKSKTRAKGKVASASDGVGDSKPTTTGEVETTRASTAEHGASRVESAA